MKHFLPLHSQIVALASIILFSTSGLRAQEAMALDEAQKIAQKLASVSADAGDQPFTIDADREKPVALKGGDAGMIILPDKKLSTDVFTHAGKTVTPVAQLWTYKLNLANHGAPVEKAKLRTLTYAEGDKSRDLQLFLIGISKDDQGGLEFVIYGKGSDPVLRTPVTKVHAAKQDLPVALSGRQTGANAATITIDLFGEYTTEMGVVKIDD
jgi:hypothetical protein